MTRWTIFLGRGGTVLISIGLALLLVSLLPPARVYGSFVSTDVPPKASLLSGLRFYSSQGQAQSSYEILLTPQQGLRIWIYPNGTLNVYILEVSSQFLFQWVGGDFFNVADLEEFLEANPSVIGWSGEIRNGYPPNFIEHEHVPTKVTNATLVLSNPSSEYVRVSGDVDLMSRVVHGKARNLGQWAIPIGFVLSLPWLTQMWKRKTRRSSAS